MAVSLCCANAEAQRARFNDFFQVNPTGPVTNPTPLIVGPNNGQPAIIQGPVLGGNFGLPSTQPFITTTPPPVTIQTPNALTNPRIIAPSFDPFQTPNNPFPNFGRAQTFQQQTPQIVFPQPQPPPQFQPQLQPQIQTFPVLPQTQIQPNGFGVPFPNRQPIAAPSVNWAWPSQAWSRFRSDVVPRLLERPRVRHTWLQGSDGNELDINETEIATTLTLPNWLGTNQPLRISPGFIFHFWDGPQSAATGVDLPAQAYSAYLATDYLSDPSKNVGYEANFTIGVYSDFQNTSTDAIRLTGTGLLWRRVNSYTTIKFGAEYLDRLEVKLLPAFGVFLTPNEDLALNLYFPRPKLAQRLPRFGQYEVWSYVGAEYGGGSFAIERDNDVGESFDDRVDLNDVRAFVGLEWMGPRRVTGFFEVGYVFERELFFDSSQQTTVIEDTFLLRTGFAF